MLVLSILLLYSFIDIIKLKVMHKEEKSPFLVVAVVVVVVVVLSNGDFLQYFSQGNCSFSVTQEGKDRKNRVIFHR